MSKTSNKIVTEYGFTPGHDDEDRLHLIRDVAVPTWAILGSPPVTLLDIYFDNEDLLLHREGVSFRVRKRGKPYKKHGNPMEYRTRFKEPMQRKDPRIYESRVTGDLIEAMDVLSYVSGEIPGKAASLAYNLIDNPHREHSAICSKAILVPVAHIVSTRRTYKVGPVGTNQMPLGPPWGALVLLVLEEVTAFDIRHSQAADRLIIDGRLDLTEPLEWRSWQLAKLKLACSFPNLPGEAELLFHNIVEKLHDCGLTAEHKSKYSTFVNLQAILPI